VTTVHKVMLSRCGFFCAVRQRPLSQQPEAYAGARNIVARIRDDAAKTPVTVRRSSYGDNRECPSPAIHAINDRADAKTQKETS
jgi:hypothetical protein